MWTTERLYFCFIWIFVMISIACLCGLLWLAYYNTSRQEKKKMNASNEEAYEQNQTGIENQNPSASTSVGFHQQSPSPHSSKEEEDERLSLEEIV